MSASLASLDLRFVSNSRARTDTYVFVSLCLYWLSQCFLIPILPIGPWPMWPSLADIATVLLIPSVLLSRGESSTVSWIIRKLFLLWGICFFSFLIATAIYGLKDRGVPLGLAQLTRLAQLIIAALATSKLRLTPERVKILARTATFIFFATVGGVLLTAVIPLVTGVAALLLPTNALVSGPWGAYAAGLIPGVGFVGYTHAYTGMQMILLAGLVLSLAQYAAPMRSVIWLFLLVSTFFSESRTAFLLSLVMIVAFEAKKSKAILVVLALSCVGIAAYLAGSEDFSTYLERQKSSSTAFEENGLSGRTDIWQQHIDYFKTNPYAVIWGSGFGFAIHAAENNAHMLYLHVPTEMGILGLMAFFAFFWKFMENIKPSRPIWLTVAVLLITGLTQETFYPVLAFNQFLAFFFSAVIAAVRVASMKTVTLTIGEYEI